MSYTVLARKWRPRTFAEMVGQEHVLKALTNALDANRLHHAFLFAGTRGVGKTTVARIFAKCINCETGVTSSPCDNCASCGEIDDGRFVDLIEVDAASRTKVDDTRELLDNVQYTPTRGRFKVYLIDEVHMLSRHSFNALLKTLEEPPPHVKFLLATTDPQRLPVTVLSRCLQFNLKRLTQDLIAGQLATLCKAESFEHDADALALLARAADGSMRDGLSLLDQAVAFGAGSVRHDDVIAMLGTVDRQYVVRLLDAAAKGDAPGCMEIIADMDQYAPDYAGVLNDMASLLQRAAVARLVPASLPTDATLAAAIKSVASAMGDEDLQLAYQIAVTGRRDLGLAPDPRAGFEMIVLRMLAFRPPTLDERRVSESASNAPPTEVDTTVAPAEDHANVEDGSPSAASVAAIAPPAASALPDVDHWHALFDELPLSGAVRNLAANCALAELADTRARLELATELEHLVAIPEMRERLAAAFSAHFGRTMSVTVDAVASTAETPAQRNERIKAAHQSAAADSLHSDPAVQAFKDTFGATVDGNTIKPLGD
ncbi:MAG: DNA polymerase III subunit gamma/tau [Pseudomonadota bacterium]